MNKIVLFLLFIAFTFASAAITPKTPELGSDGYYHISSAEELWGFSNLVNQRAIKDSSMVFNAKLDKDIVINKNVLNENDTLSKDTSEYESFRSIGMNSWLPYHGVFDGQGHAISGIVQFDVGDGFIYDGLFYNTKNAIIKNLNIVDSYFGGVHGSLIATMYGGVVENISVDARVIGRGDSGGLIGTVGGVVRNCIFKGFISVSDIIYSSMTGGIAGWAQGVVHDCVNKGRVEGFYNVGGIVGSGWTINCRNLGAVKGFRFVGGVIGRGNTYYCRNSGSVIGITDTSSYVGGVVGVGPSVGGANSGDVQGAYRVGGVSGSAGLISGSYNTGKVTGKDYVGGVVGDGYVTSSFNMGAVKGETRVGALDGGPNGSINSFALVSSTSLLNGSETGDVEGDTLGGKFITSSEFSDGSILEALESKRGSVAWIQGDEHPEIKPVADPQVKENYYEISNASQLVWFAQVVNLGLVNDETKAVLTDDIVFHKDLVKSVKAVPDSVVLNYEKWESIGNHTHYFKGMFDGQGHSISGLYKFHGDKFDVDTLGLFFGDNPGSVIKNLSVKDSYFRGRNHVGGIIAISYGSLINLHFSGYVKGGYYVGGIVGYMRRGVFRDCSNEGEVYGSGYVGGIAGSSSVNISRSYNTGTISGGWTQGGIAGESPSISYCYNWGTIEASKQRVGGLVADSSTKIVSSYNVGPIVTKGATDSYRLNFVDTLGSNNYILKNTEAEETVLGKGTREMSAEEFADGTVKDLLNEGSDYDVWVQGEEYPVIAIPAKPKIKDGAFQISNASELHWFMEYVNDSLADENTKAVLVDDIVLGGPWTPIGYGYSKGFEGEFDGQGHSISGVNIFEKDSSKKNIGFFTELSATALVKNLTLKEAAVKGGWYYTGGLVGENKGRIENCLFEGSVEAKDYLRSGMIAGYNKGALFGNIGICETHCDTINVSGDTSRYRYYTEKFLFDRLNFAVASSDKNDKKFKDGSFALEMNSGVKDLLWKQGENFPYMAVETPEFKDGAYQINNLSQLFWATSYGNVSPAKPMSLTDDIEVNKVKNLVFRNLYGSFDGNGHHISGLYGDFFVDSVKTSGSITNLNIDDAHLTTALVYNGGVVSKCSVDVKSDGNNASWWRSIGLLANINNGIIRDVVVKGSFAGADDEFKYNRVGGVVGVNELNIINARFEGAVEGDSLVGGVVGYNVGNIDSSVFAGSVKGVFGVGGIVGRMDLFSGVENSVSNGIVVGIQSVGGIAGNVYRSNKKLKNCYNASAVKGEKWVGGIAGYVGVGELVSDCINVGTISADSNAAGGLVGFLSAKAKLSYSIVYDPSEKPTVIGMIADEVAWDASVDHCYAFSKARASLVRSVRVKDSITDVAFKTEEEFRDGTVLKLLTEGRSSYRWVQGKDYPVFGDVTINPVVAPENPEDSTKVVLPRTINVPLFGVNTLARDIQVFNAPAGSEFALMDMMGRVIARGIVPAGNFQVHAPHAGSYLLKVGSYSQQVNVK